MSDTAPKPPPSKLTADQEVALCVLRTQGGSISAVGLARSGWLIGKTTRECEAVLTSLIGTGLVGRVVQPAPGNLRRFPDVTYLLTASGTEYVKSLKVSNPSVTRTR